MDFTFKKNTILIDSDKKEILLSKEFIDLDGLKITMAGEYEKSSVLMYAYSHNGETFYHFRTEGYWVAYIPSLLTDITPDALDFLGSVDILIMPGAKIMQPVVEKIEPRLLITYGDMAHEISLALGIQTEFIPKYRLKDVDLSLDKTGCVILGE